MKSRLMIVSEPYLSCVEDLQHLNSNDLLLMADDGQISVTATKQLLTLQRELSLSVGISALKGENQAQHMQSLAYQMGHLSESYDQFTLIMDLPNYEISAIAAQFDCQADLYITPDPHAAMTATSVVKPEAAAIVESASELQLLDVPAAPATETITPMVEAIEEKLDAATLSPSLALVEETAKPAETIAEPAVAQTADVVELAEQPIRKNKKDNNAVINAVMQKFASSRQYDPLQTSKPTAGIAVEGATE